MSKTTHDDEEQARQTIRTWLTAHNRSLRNLAREAGIPPSVISKFFARRNQVGSEFGVEAVSCDAAKLESTGAGDLSSSHGLAAFGLSVYQ